MQESFDLSHRETQTTLPGPLGKIGLWDKIGTWALPASSLSLASAIVFVMTLLFLRRSQEMRSLFMLPTWGGLLTAVVASGVAWGIVVLCSGRPGRLWPRLWALGLAFLNSASVILLFLFPEVTWISAMTVTGTAATLTLLPRLLRLPPDSAMIPRIAPLAALIVLLVVLPTAWCVGESIAASKRDRVSEMIEQLREWTAEVKAVASRGWSGGGWDDAARAVGALEQIQLAGKLDISLWREASSLDRDLELAEAARNLLDATVQGFAPNRVPRVSRLRDPAFYYDPTAKRWEESSVFPKASATVGRYYQELGRIFQELDIQESFVESEGLSEIKKSYLEKRSDLEAFLRPQMEEWTDHWAIFRIPGRESLLGYSEMPLGKLLTSSIPDLGVPAADFPRLFSLSYQSVSDRKLIPGCRPLAPYSETAEDGAVYQYARLDCYSYAPQANSLGAYPRVEMRLVYKSTSNGYLLIDQKPTEVYFLFPLPEGQAENEFQKQVMSDLAEAVRETTKREVTPINRSNSVERGFRVRGEGRRITVYDPYFISLYEDRKALQVRAERLM